MRGRVLAGVAVLSFLLADACAGTPAHCSPVTCPTGCCDRSGECVPGTSESGCGSAGAACAICSSPVGGGGWQRCTDQRCVSYNTGGGGGGGGP